MATRVAADDPRGNFGVRWRVVANTGAFLSRVLMMVTIIVGDFGCHYCGGGSGMRVSAFTGDRRGTALGSRDSTVRGFRATAGDHRRMPTISPAPIAPKRTTATAVTHRAALPSFLEGSQATMSSEESLLLFWIAAFASSHIGMSAIRRTLITDVLGTFLADEVLGIVGTGSFRLPDFWPGDSSGTNELFPDVETTGRQFYRIFYTMVSFLTLGTSFSIYLSLRGEDDVLRRSIDVASVLDGTGSDPAMTVLSLSYAVAALSGAFSLASLVNASPLGLMPSFRSREDDGGAAGFSPVPTTAGSDLPNAGDTILGITRDDSLKFDPKGLTRITRHPLILPVFPWGIATSVLAGGRPADCILFGGLSLYAVAGCYCQDLRVTREEGSVGTVFFGPDGDAATAPSAASGRTIQTKLKSFYDQTSFVPFGALLRGRQPLGSTIREFPILPFLMAIPASFAIETVFLRFLGVDYSIL